MIIEKYGVQWNVTAKESGRDVEVSLRNGGLWFIGDLGLDLYRGAYVQVHTVKINDYFYPMIPIFFYSKELESFTELTADTRQIKKLYDDLRSGRTFPKDLFKSNNNTYFLAINSEDSAALRKLFVPVEIEDVCKIDPDDFYIVAIDKHFYEQLPDPWTITDLFKPISKEIDAICYAEEAIWRDIAEYFLRIRITLYVS